MAELRDSIERIGDPGDKQISRAMVILISSLEVGADVDRLAKRTGFPVELIKIIAHHMAEAGLWTGLMVDDSEWWDDHGEFDGMALFLHAQVALGHVQRKTTSDYVAYIDRKTGQEVHRCERLFH